MTSKAYGMWPLPRIEVKSFLCAAVFAALLLPAVAVSAADPGGKKPARDFAALFPLIEKADAVVEGAKQPRRVFYVFFDANCWYCHLTWKALQPYEQAGLQVRWVPVAYQKDSSTTKAAAIMLAKDRVAALRENELGYKPGSYDGGIAPVKAPKAIEAQLEANFELMDRFGVSGTPGLVWKDEKGGVQVKTGMPRLSQLPAMTGLPKQKHDDPELADFR